MFQGIECHYALAQGADIGMPFILASARGSFQADIQLGRTCLSGCKSGACDLGIYIVVSVAVVSISRVHLYWIIEPNAPIVKAVVRWHLESYTLIHRITAICTLLS